MVIDGKNFVIESRVVGDLEKADWDGIARIIAHAYNNRGITDV